MDINIHGTELSLQQALNLILRDTDSDGEGDAIAVCNPDGTEV